MQVIFIINVVLMFCIGGFLLHYFYRISDDKAVAFHIVNNVASIKDTTKNLKKKAQLLSISDGSVSVIDLQELNYHLLKKGRRN
ncbi:MAG: hypothetical protein ACTJLM_03745 [Ehrlichia sp.]